MAETSQQSAAKPQEEAEPTRRVVLSKVRVLLVPDALPDDALAAAYKSLGGKGAAPEQEAWVNVGEFDGKSKDESIEGYAGKPGTPDAKTGEYKAVPVKSFAGGARYKAPPKPLVEREAIE